MIFTLAISKSIEIVSYEWKSESNFGKVFENQRKVQLWIALGTSDFWLSSFHIVPYIISIISTGLFMTVFSANFRESTKILLTHKTEHKTNRNRTKQTFHSTFNRINIHTHTQRIEIKEKFKWFIFKRWRNFYAPSFVWCTVFVVVVVAFFFILELFAFYRIEALCILHSPEYCKTSPLIKNFWCGEKWKEKKKQFFLYIHHKWYNAQIIIKLSLHSFLHLSGDLPHLPCSGPCDEGKIVCEMVQLWKP